MEAAIGSITVFVGAIGVQQPCLHGGVEAIIGKALDHRITWPTIRAVNVGISEARIARIKKFVQAVFAHRQIRRDPGSRPVEAVTFPNRKFTYSEGCYWLNVNFRDAGCGWRLRFQIMDECLQSLLGTFEVNFDTLLAIQHPSAQRVSHGQAIDERTKSDALHHSPHSD